jgi:hypothetical protein
VLEEIQLHGDEASYRLVLKLDRTELSVISASHFTPTRAPRTNYRREHMGHRTSLIMVAKRYISVPHRTELQMLCSYSHFTDFSVLYATKM